MSATAGAASDQHFSLALRLANEGWEEVRRSPFTQSQLGSPLTRLPHISPEESQRRSAVAKSLLARLETIDVANLPHDLALSLPLLKFRAR